MSISTIRTLIAIVLIAHGLGHALGILAAMGITLSKNHSLYSWLLTKFTGQSVSTGIGVLVFSAVLIGFICTGLSLGGWLLPRHVWQTLGLIAAIVSLTGLCLFWNAFPFLFPNKIGVLFVDIGLLVSILWLQWPAKIT
jgi:hypothetical protein